MILVLKCDLYFLLMIAKYFISKLKLLRILLMILFQLHGTLLLAFQSQIHIDRISFLGLSFFTGLAPL